MVTDGMLQRVFSGTKANRTFKKFCQIVWQYVDMKWGEVGEKATGLEATNDMSGKDAVG